ncbi:transcriptional regulator, GntR family [Pseudosulfitobacter pseudonitzschiae]|nr:GntR family transcriptional regulator [Pseudosulfitobacter pseudonitzschiae]QKS07334.1 GntR family transcriptional regulator [Pseudosulfitobacter pseudonitzschiae]SHF95271.1 transcriptional regulator, GntR family [Pseudosulfitobacter pseudonitzschiae]
MSSAADLAYEFIKSAVMSGEFRAGDRVKEELVAEQIGISRTPIRTAMQRLAAQGFIEILHNQGARVANWSSEDSREITELRAVLEAFGAGIAAKRINAENLDELRELSQQMEDASAKPTVANFERITELNSRFHMAIIAASGNARLADVIGNLAHPLLVQRKFSTFDSNRLARSMSDHRELIQAFERGDSDWASAIMRAHILASAEQVA